MYDFVTCALKFFIYSRRVTSASSILCLRDFSLALALHSSSSFYFLNTCSSSSLSLYSSASLALEEFGSWGASFSRLWSSTVGGSSSVTLVVTFLLPLPISVAWSWESLSTHKRWVPYDNPFFIQYFYNNHF